MLWISMPTVFWKNEHLLGGLVKDINQFQIGKIGITQTEVQNKVLMAQ